MDILTGFQKGIYQKEYAPYECGELDHANFERRHLRLLPAARGLFFYPHRSVTGGIRYERSSSPRSFTEEAGGLQFNPLYVRD